MSDPTAPSPRSRVPVTILAGLVTLTVLQGCFSFSFSCGTAEEAPGQGAAPPGPDGATGPALAGQGAAEGGPPVATPDPAAGQGEPVEEAASGAPVAGAEPDAAVAAEEAGASPPFPGWEAGPVACWRWLVASQADYTIDDLPFRFMFGGIAIPILLLFEWVGIRQGVWLLYPFLLPFWLGFGIPALGPVLGLQAVAAHLIGFPLARLLVVASGRRRSEPGRVGPPGRPEHDAPEPPDEPAAPAGPPSLDAPATPTSEASRAAFRPDLSRFRRRP